jgi:hypothetical protein
MKIVAARSLRNHHRGPRSPAQGRQVALASQPRRPAHQPRRQARRTYRLRAPLFRLRSHRFRHLRCGRFIRFSLLARDFVDSVESTKALTVGRLIGCAAISGAPATFSTRFGSTFKSVRARADAYLRTIEPTILILLDRS